MEAGKKYRVWPGKSAAGVSFQASLERSLPVPGGSDSALTLENVYRKVGSVDFGFVPGRGIFGHPMGPKAGASSIRQAWDAIERGASLDSYAETHPELMAMLSK